MKQGIGIFSKLLSLLFIIMLISQYKVLGIIFEYNYLLGGFSFFIMVPWLFLVLNVGAAIGLFNVKSYGYWLAYMAITFTSYAYGFSYLPWTHWLLPYIKASSSMAAVNILLFLLVFVCHVTGRRYARHHD